MFDTKKVSSRSYVLVICRSALRLLSQNPNTKYARKQKCGRLLSKHIYKNILSLKSPEKKRQFSYKKECNSSEQAIDEGKYSIEHSTGEYLPSKSILLKSDGPEAFGKKSEILFNWPIQLLFEKSDLRCTL